MTGMKGKNQPKHRGTFPTLAQPPSTLGNVFKLEIHHLLPLFFFFPAVVASQGCGRNRHSVFRTNAL